jgi:hypothetical protein
MKKTHFVLAAFLLFPFCLLIGQNPAIPKPKDSKELQITVPESPTEYSIEKYKNVDYLKTNPFQLESAGLHPEIYISNTKQGVIIIYTSDSNNLLNDFSKILEQHPTYYETHTRQDTLVFSKANPDQTLDFTKASSISHEYNNAFNFTVDPRTGVSWRKGTHKDFLQGDLLNKNVYDLIIVLPKTQTK